MAEYKIQHHFKYVALALTAHKLVWLERDKLGTHSMSQHDVAVRCFSLSQRDRLHTRQVLSLGLAWTLLLQKQPSLDLVLRNPDVPRCHC